MCSSYRQVLRGGRLHFTQPPPTANVRPRSGGAQQRWPHPNLLLCPSCILPRCIVRFRGGWERRRYGGLVSVPDGNLVQDELQPFSSAPRFTGAEPSIGSSPLHYIYLVSSSSLTHSQSHPLRHQFRIVFNSTKAFDTDCHSFSFSIPIPTTSASSYFFTFHLLFLATLRKWLQRQSPQPWLQQPTRDLQPGTFTPISFTQWTISQW